MNRYQRRAAKSSRKIPKKANHTFKVTKKGLSVDHTINFGNRPVFPFQTDKWGNSK